MMKYLIPFLLLSGTPRLMWAEEADQVPTSKPIKGTIWQF